MKDLESILNNANEILKFKIGQLYGDNKLKFAIKHSLFEGKSKKLRSKILICIAMMCGGNKQMAEVFSMAIECIHTYSLIFDDLPDFDNSCKRRGVNACHVEFDNSTAMLAGNALIGCAVYLISNDDFISNAVIKSKASLIISELVQNLSIGQFKDMKIRDMAKKDLPIDEAVDIYFLKTSYMFCSVCKLAILCIPDEVIEKLHDYLYRCCKNFGLLYQFIDDFRDLDNDKYSIIRYVNYRCFKEYFFNMALETKGLIDNLSEFDFLDNQFLTSFIDVISLTIDSVLEDARS